MKSSIFTLMLLITCLLPFYASDAAIHTVKMNPDTAPHLLRINMTGPGSISRTGGPYTYTVNLSPFGGQVAQGAAWTIIANGQDGCSSYTYKIPADETATGSVSINLSGSTFGSTGTFTVYLTTDPCDTPVLIYGSRGVTVL